MLPDHKSLENESFKCLRCDKQITENQIEEVGEWRCPSCNCLLVTKYNNNYIERKHITEVVEWDFVLLYDGNFYKVFSNNPGKGKRGMDRLMLEGFGYYDFDHDSYVNCEARYRYRDE